MTSPTPSALVMSSFGEGVLTLTLNRPAQLNSFTGDMHVELMSALEAAADNTTSMKQYIADIARVATEQSQGVTQINLALRPMEQVTQQNAALVSQAASDSQRLDNLSVTMKGLVNRFVV